MRLAGSCVVLAAVLLVGRDVPAFEVRQHLREGVYTRGNVNMCPLQPIDSASWIWRDEPKDFRSPCVRFRRTFRALPEKLRVDVSADSRFILLLDGQVIARGPHKGAPIHWYYQTYDVEGLPEGEHRMEAIVFHLGEKGPPSILTSGRGGFVFKAEGAYDDVLTTGKVDWEVAKVGCLSFRGKTDPRTLAGCENVLTGTGIVDGEVSDWKSAVVVRGPITGRWAGVSEPDWPLFPTERPDPFCRTVTPGAMRAAKETFAQSGPYEERDVRNAWVEKFQDLLTKGTEVVIPAGKEVRVLWDYGDYYCGFPEVDAEGGEAGEIRWAWAENMRDAAGERGNRDVFLGKTVRYAMWDTFKTDGRSNARFTTPWWKSGRWAELSVRAGNTPLRITRLALAETRYPLEPEAGFECDDPTVASVQRICVRGMQNCLHEMFMDCPYFEQQMYPGDARVEMLVLNAIDGRDHMLRYGISIFDYARRNNGFVPMNFPTRPMQDSSTYAMAWVDMLGDYVLWHGTNEFFRMRIPGMRHTLDALALYEDADGLVRGLPGWSFMDWVPEWGRLGTAPEGETGCSSVVNLFYLYALRAAAGVERAAGNQGMAALTEGKASRLGRALVRRFWSERDGLVADTEAKDRFSEHAQCLALLTDVLSKEQADRTLENLIARSDLARTTVYFSHYLFDVLLKFGRTDLFLKRLDLWRDYVKLGLKTPLEAPGVRGRSDCHAWGAHPIYHLITGVAGVRPAKPGYAAVMIAPQPGSLTWLKATAPTPRGLVRLNLRFEGTGVKGTVDVPPGLPGVFEWRGVMRKLKPGENMITQPQDGCGVGANVL